MFLVFLGGHLFGVLFTLILRIWGKPVERASQIGIGRPQLR